MQKLADQELQETISPWKPKIELKEFVNFVHSNVLVAPYSSSLSRAIFTILHVSRPELVTHIQASRCGASDSQGRAQGCSVHLQLGHVDASAPKSGSKAQAEQNSVY